MDEIGAPFIAQGSTWVEGLGFKGVEETAKGFEARLKRWEGND